MEQVRSISRTHLSCGFPLIMFGSAPSKKEYLCIGCLLKELLDSNETKNDTEKKEILKKIIFGLRITCDADNNSSEIHNVNRKENVVVDLNLFEGLICAAKKSMHTPGRKDDFIKLFGGALIIAFCHKLTRKVGAINLCCRHLVQSFQGKPGYEDSNFIKFIVCVVEKMTEWMNAKGVPLFGSNNEENAYVKCFVFGLLPQILKIPQMVQVALRVINNFIDGLHFVTACDDNFEGCFKLFINEIIQCTSKYIVSIPNPKVRKDSLSKRKKEKKKYNYF